MRRARCQPAGFGYKKPLVCDEWDQPDKPVREGKFHIYAVSTIDQDIEVLTGTPAGEQDEDGTYPEGTVHFLVEERIREMVRQAREFAEGDEEEAEEKAKEDEEGTVEPEKKDEG